MRLHCKNVVGAHVLVDTGTNRRVPFAVWFDHDTGEYEAQEWDGGPTYRGKAVGRLVMVPFSRARNLIDKPETTVATLTSDAKIGGLDAYRAVYRKVWQFRGEARKHIDQRWIDYLRRTPFYDNLDLSRRCVSVRAATRTGTIGGGLSSAG